MISRGLSGRAISWRYLAVTLAIVLTMIGLFAHGNALGQTASPGTTASDTTAPIIPTQLQVAVVERAPFVFQDGNATVGFSIDLLNEIADTWRASVSLIPANSFTEMLDRVVDGTVDMAIANISITAQREERMNFSQPIFDSGLQILVPSTGSGSSLTDVIFNWRMLSLVLLAAAAIFVVGNLMWFFEKDKSPYFQKSYRDGMWPSFWWAMHALISGGFEEHVPRSIPGRFLGTALLISTLFLVSAFVATLTSAMTISELRADIETVSDLHEKKVGSTSGSTASAYLQERGVEHTRYDSIDQLLDAVASRQLDAAVHDAPVLAYYAASRGKGRVQLTGKIFKSEKYGIALPNDSQLAESLNRAILQLRESGRYDEIYRKWFGT